jgi:hypothetical protein
MTKLWVRGSSFGERLWNPEANKTSTTSNLVKRLYGMEQRLVWRGYGASPVTVEYCSRNIDVCFKGR